MERLLGKEVVVVLLFEYTDVQGEVAADGSSLWVEGKQELPHRPGSLVGKVKLLDWCARNHNGNRNVLAVIKRAEFLRNVYLTEEEEQFFRMFPIEREMSLCLKKGRAKRSFHKGLARWTKALLQEAERMREERYRRKPHSPPPRRVLSHIVPPIPTTSAARSALPA